LKKKGSYRYSFFREAFSLSSPPSPFWHMKEIWKNNEWSLCKGEFQKCTFACVVVVVTELQEFSASNDWFFKFSFSFLCIYYKTCNGYYKSIQQNNSQTRSIN
jgi:hypothetical protein